MIELTFCESKPLPRPLFSSSSLPILFRAMVLDGLITPRLVSRLLQSSAMINCEGVTLELLESIAPSQVYRVFRWLRGFCREDHSYPDEIALNVVIPHVSAVIALSSIFGRSTRTVVKAKVPRQAPRSLVAAVDRIAGIFGIPLEIQRCEESPALPVWSAPPAVDLISHALGEAAAAGRDILVEALESGGSIVGRALLDLLGRERRFVLKLLTTFDFLRPHVTGGGLVFALTQKSLEALL
ncbi:MAG: hypothetical protein QXP94_01445 [Thermofilaceae archaeon]